MDTAQSKILADLKQRSKSSYETVKETEVAKRSELPCGLTNAVAICTGTKFGTYETGKNVGDPFVNFYSYVVEPEEFTGSYCGQAMPLLESQTTKGTRSEEKNRAEVCQFLEYLGYGALVENAGDFIEMLNEVLQLIDTQNPTFLFNTGRTPKKDGSAWFNPSGPTPDGYEIPDFAKKNEHPDTHKEVTKREKEKKQVSKKKKGAKTEMVPRFNTCRLDELPPFRVGEQVKTINNHYNDGEDYEGQVTALSDEGATVLFDDGTGEEEIPFVDLEAVEDDIPFELEVDDRVTSVGDFWDNGDEYEGTIVGLSGDNALVKFDGEDGPEEIPLENLQPLT